MVALPPCECNSCLFLIRSSSLLCSIHDKSQKLFGNCIGKRRPHRVVLFGSPGLRLLVLVDGPPHKVARALPMVKSCNVSPHFPPLRRLVYCPVLCLGPCLGARRTCSARLHEPSREACGGHHDHKRRNVASSWLAFSPHPEGRTLLSEREKRSPEFQTRMP
jgi:hypothetical protein